MKTVENLLRTITRALLGNPKFEPEISVERNDRRQMMVAEVNVRPFDPSPLIGASGTMKMAIKTMLAGRVNLDCCDLLFRTTGRLESPRLSGVKPAIEPMKSVMDAAVEHWRALGHQAEARIETSETTVVAILILEEGLGNAQRPAVSRIARAIGKANGYRGTVIIEKPAALVQ